jgi:tetratricopeptide (TPR) repeat protein
VSRALFRTPACRLIAVVLVCGALFSCTPSSQSESLVSDAAALVTAAAAAEAESYVRASQFYGEASSTLNNMAKAFPDSAQAASFRAGTLMVGAFTAAQLEQQAAKIAARARAESDPLECAAFVVERIASASARAEFSAALADAWIEQGDTERGRLILGRASAALKEVVDEHDRSMARAALARVWARLGHERAAAAQVAAVDSGQALARVLALLAIHEVVGPEVEAADIAAAPADWDPSAVAAEIIDRQQWARGLLRSARAQIDAMDKSTRERPWAIAALAAAEARVGNEREVQRLIATLGDGSDRVRGAVAVAAAWRERGDRAADARWLGLALEAAGGIEDSYLLAMALSETAGGYIAAGADERARELLDQSLSIARKIDELSPSRSGALAKIARKYAALGEESEAMVIAEVMLDQGQIDSAWARAGIARALASASRFRRAVPVVFSISQRQVRRQTLAAVLLEEARRPEAERTSDAFTLHRILLEFG